MSKIKYLLLVLALFISMPAPIESRANVSSICGEVSQKPIKIRMLILKHSREYIVDNDAGLATRAVESAAQKGLQIKVIGNYEYMKPVNDEDVAFTNILDLPEEVKIEKFQNFVSEKMKIDANPHDTLIIFTIGHGFSSGGLQNVGKRSDVMKAFANAAEENHQQVIWWQLSCHACAGLPKITSLPPVQQKLFSVLASSPANEESPSGVEGHIMSRIFNAIADKSNKIDLNSDGVITADEFRSFLRNDDRDGLFFALSGDTPVFGYKGLDIPIIDHIDSQGKYDEDYVPIP